MVASVKKFFYDYFVSPIINREGAYNPFNTIVYALLFALAAVYLVYHILKYLKLKVDRRFVFGVSPYVVLGALLRALADVFIKEGANIPFLLTPLIYIEMFLFTLATLLISLWINRSKYFKVWHLIGVFCVGMVLPHFHFENYVRILPVIGVVALWAVPLYIFLYVILRRQNLKGEALAFGGQMFDASTTYITTSFYGGWEEHVLPSFFMGALGPYSIFLLKVVVLIPVLYYLRRVEKDDRNYVLFVIGLLGFAIGLRNLLSLMV